MVSARKHLRRSIAIGLSAVLMLIGCGGSVKQTSVSHPPQGDVPLKPMPLPSPGQFYSTGLEYYADKNGHRQTELERSIHFVLKRSIMPPPAMDCLAREYAARFAADGKDPLPSTVHALARHCGYWGLPQNSLSLTAPSAEALLESLKRVPTDLVQGMVAVGAVEDPNGPVTVSLLKPPRDLTLLPVSRIQPTFITGQIQRDDGVLEAWVEDASGRIHPLDSKSSTTGQFMIEVPQGPRFSRIELTRKHGDFRQTIALIQLGKKQESYAWADAYPITPSDFDLIRGQIETRINEHRAQAQRAPLKIQQRLLIPLDDWLSRIANRSAPSTPPGLLDDRGWKYANVHYGLSSGEDGTRIADLFFARPTGRAIILDENINELGVGLRAFPHGHGADAVIVGLERFEAHANTQLTQRLLTMTNEIRKATGHMPLNNPSPLNQIIQPIADRVLTGELPWARAMEDMLKAIRQSKLVKGSVAIGGFTSPNLSRLEFAPEDAAMKPSARHIGFGIAGGLLPGDGSPRYVVVYFVSGQH